MFAPALQQGQGVLRAVLEWLRALNEHAAIQLEDADPSVLSTSPDTSVAVHCVLYDHYVLNSGRTCRPDAHPTPPSADDPGYYYLLMYL